jgi:hypothetical protein
MRRSLSLVRWQQTLLIMQGEKQYDIMWIHAYQHFAKYDMPDYNGGGLYPKAK